MGCAHVLRLPTGGSIAMKEVQTDETEIVVVVVQWTHLHSKTASSVPMLLPKKKTKTNDTSDNLG